MIGMVGVEAAKLGSTRLAAKATATSNLIRFLHNWAQARSTTRAPSCQGSGDPDSAVILRLARSARRLGGRPEIAGGRRAEALLAVRAAISIVEDRGNLG